MPPRRKHKLEDGPSPPSAADAAQPPSTPAPPPILLSNPLAGVAKSTPAPSTPAVPAAPKKDESTEPAKKKQKLDEPPAPTTAAATSSNASSKDEDDDTEGMSASEDEDLPICWYGDKCYRKNPQHFKEYRHPHVDSEGNPKPKKSDKKSSSSAVKVADTPKPATKAAKAPIKKKPIVDDEEEEEEKPGEKEKQKQPVAIASIQATTTTTSAKGASDNGTERKEVGSYRAVITVVLSKNKITVEEKRMLRGFRRTFSITDEEHRKILKEFDWTEDQYEDGEKHDENIELDEENEILKSPTGFGVIKLIKGQKMTRQQENVFARVNTVFYETMSKAQGNYKITEVWVVVNRPLKEKYEEKKNEFKSVGKDVSEIFAFHGSGRDSIMGISKTNFLPPDRLPKADDGKKKKGSKYKGKGKGKKDSGPKVTVLDDGYFGKGIYCSLYSDYAMWYSEERGSDQVLLAKLFRGKVFECPKRMDGAGQQPGYDCHKSPKGNEIIMFDPDQILPRYVVTFVTKEAEEREQES